MSVMLPTKMQSEWLPIEHCSVTAFLVYKFLQACNPKYFNLFTNQDAECTMLTEIKTLVQSWGFMSRSVASVILKQILNIAANNSQTFTEVTARDEMANLLTDKPLRTTSRCWCDA